MTQFSANGRAGANAEVADDTLWPCGLARLLAGLSALVFQAVCRCGGAGGPAVHASTGEGGRGGC